MPSRLTLREALEGMVQDLCLFDREGKCDGVFY